MFALLFLALHYFCGNKLDTGTISDVVFKFTIILQLDILIILTIGVLLNV